MTVKAVRKSLEAKLGLDLSDRIAKIKELTVEALLANSEPVVKTEPVESMSPVTPKSEASSEDAEAEKPSDEDTDYKLALMLQETDGKRGLRATSKRAPAKRKKKTQGDRPTKRGSGFQKPVLLAPVLSEFFGGVDEASPKFLRSFSLIASV